MGIYIYLIYLFLMQRISIPEIQKHPWFLKNLPKEFMEGEEDGFQNMNSNESNNPSQSIEEVITIIQEARKPVKGGPKIEGQFVGMGGSVDIDDEIDTDADLDDETETSGDFVCSL